MEQEKLYWQRGRMQLACRSRVWPSRVFQGWVNQVPMAVAECRDLLFCIWCFPSQLGFWSFPSTHSSYCFLPDNGPLVGNAFPFPLLVPGVSRAALSILAPHSATLWDVPVHWQQNTKPDIFCLPGLSLGEAASRDETTARYHHFP